MAYKIWNESADNISQVSDFNSNSITGFEANTIISSQEVNSILRQDSLFTTAFLSILNDAGIDTTNVGFNSSLASMKAILAQWAKPLYRHHFDIWINVTQPALQVDIINTNKNFIISNATPESYPNSTSTSYTSAVNKNIAEALLTFGNEYSTSGVFKLLKSGTIDTYNTYMTTHGYVKVDSNVEYIINFVSYMLSSPNSTDPLTYPKNVAIYGNDSQSSPDQTGTLIAYTYIQPVLVQEYISKIQ